jgi:hypothetical protein
MRTNTASQWALPSVDLQTLRPHLRLHGPVLLLLFVGFLVLFFFLSHGIPKILYSVLSILGMFAVLFQFSKEYRLVHDRLNAVAVVTDYRVPMRGNSWIVRFIMRKFSPDVPVIEYSFVAFDQKTYTGRTGWNARGLYKGAKIRVLYKPGKPAVNHPVTSFIFYSFG